MSNVTGGRQKVPALALLQQVHPVAFKARRKTQDRGSVFREAQPKTNWGGHKNEDPETDIHTLKAMS